MRNRPHRWHLRAASFFWPGIRSLPNMARTTMPIRKSVTTLTIMSKAKARIGRAIFDQRYGAGPEGRAEAA